MDSLETISVLGKQVVTKVVTLSYILDVVDQLIENGTLDEVILVKPDGSLPGT